MKVKGKNFSGGKMKNNPMPEKEEKSCGNTFCNVKCSDINECVKYGYYTPKDKSLPTAQKENPDPGEWEKEFDKRFNQCGYMSDCDLCNADEIKIFFESLLASQEEKQRKEFCEFLGHLRDDTCVLMEEIGNKIKELERKRGRLLSI